MSATASATLPANTVSTETSTRNGMCDCGQSLHESFSQNHPASVHVCLRLAFSVRETAEILGVSEKTVRRLISRGLLRPSRALRHLLLSRKEIERFLENTGSR